MVSNFSNRSVLKKSNLCKKNFIKLVIRNNRRDTKNEYWNSLFSPYKVLFSEN